MIRSSFPTRFVKIGSLSYKTTLDHIIPKILGGSNQQDNLQLLCIACHRMKDVSSGYWKNKGDMYKMLKIGFILEYDGFARIIVTHVLHKKLDLTSTIEKKSCLY